MKTVVSQTGLEVLYPCFIHILNGEILECEYKSEQIGQELMNFICDRLVLPDKDYWGFNFLDCFEQRHWLDLSRLIRPQVKNVCPIHLLFRVKVYPPEPYKLEDATKFQIFMQLRLDLKSGRLCCGISDAALLLSLILQYQLGDYNPEMHHGNYVHEKYLQNQSFVIEMKCLSFHKGHLTGITKEQTMDLFLRLASQLETYGVDPFLVEDRNKQRMTLWVNYKGIETFVNAERIHHLEWLSISRIKQNECSLFVHLASGEFVEFICLTKAECCYIYEAVIDHLRYFTTSGAKSTTGIIGSETVESLEEEILSLVSNKLKDQNAFSDYGIEHSDLSGDFVEKKTQDVNQGQNISSYMRMLKNWQITAVGFLLAICLELYFYSSSRATIKGFGIF